MALSGGGNPAGAANHDCSVQGLEAQLLGSVVRKERPELEEQKQSLVLNIAAGKRKLQELEDEILRCGGRLRIYVWHHVI